MNVSAHQEKEKNDETMAGKRGKGEERKKKRKQATDFEEAMCCLFCCRLGGSIAKK